MDRHWHLSRGVSSIGLNIAWGSSMLLIGSIVTDAVVPWFVMGTGHISCSIGGASHNTWQLVVVGPTVSPSHSVTVLTMSPGSQVESIWWSC